MNVINNEKGVALILALVMLVLMSILGALVISTSTTEVGITGNYRKSQEAFYAADRAVEYASTDATIYTNAALLTANNPVDLNAAPYKDNIFVNNQTRTGYGLVSGLDSSETNTVTYLGVCASMVGTGSEADVGMGGGGMNNYKHYLINITTTTRPNAALGADRYESRFSVEYQVARITVAGC